MNGNPNNMFFMGGVPGMHGVPMMPDINAII
jgi:hypothetical protein